VKVKRGSAGRNSGPASLPGNRREKAWRERKKRGGKGQQEKVALSEVASPVNMQEKQNAGKHETGAWGEKKSHIDWGGNHMLQDRICELNRRKERKSHSLRKSSGRTAIKRESRMQKGNSGPHEGKGLADGR